MPNKLLQTQSLSFDTLTFNTLRGLADGGRLYALVDACDAPDVPGKMAEWGEERAVSLYRGMAEEEFSAFAPYLAQIDGDALDWIADTLWPTPWGLFVVSGETLPALRSHFRRFLIVDDPQGEEMYFRFYDPRVLQKYLPTCNDRELRQVYGPIQAFVFGDPEQTDTLTQTARGPEAGLPAPAPAVTRRVGERFPIRAEQMAAFGAEAEAAFEQRLMAHLREHHRARVCDLPDGVLLDMTRTGIARARRYGITWESNLIAFVALMFEVAPNFDQHPRMQMILTGHNIDPENKIDLLVERTPENVWREVKARSDVSQWFRPGRGAV